MPDLIDAANATAELFTRQALADQLRKTGQAVSRSHCIDCEESISAARRAAVSGCQRCINCQHELEHDLKHWRTT